MRTKSLRSQLILGVIIVITTFVFVQLCIRGFVTYPQLKTLSNQHHVYEMQRVASGVEQEIKSLENLVYDNAVWDSTFNAAETRDVKWFERTYFLPASYATLGIDGWFFFDSQGSLITGQVVSPSSPLSTLSTQVKASGILASLSHQTNNTVGSVFASINGNPVLLVASKILPSDEQGEPNGTAVVLQRIDQTFINKITPNLQDDITFHPADSLSPKVVAQSHLFASLTPNNHSLISDPSPLPRLFIRFENPTGDVLFALSIEKHDGPENHSIVDGSLLGGVVVSMLSLIVFYGFINRKLISPIEEILSLLKRAQETSDFSMRCEVEGKTEHENEVQKLGLRLNNLLSLIEDQQHAVSEKNRVLEDLSRTDALTGLSNRRYLDEWMTSLAENENTTEKPLSLLVIDIDYFKRFNDFYGHARGDDTLKIVANSIKQSLHEATDHAFRYGGEEFIAILQDTSAEDAQKVAENIRKHVESLHIEHAASLVSGYITLSIGVSSKPPLARLNVHVLFNDADNALYQAKKQGRNTVAISH